MTSPPENVRKKLCGTIMAFGHYMNKPTKIRILDIVMYHIEDYSLNKDDILTNSVNGINIDLDKLDECVLKQICSIIERRMEILNTPYVEGVTPF